MNRFALILSILAISSCAAYKVEKSGPIDKVTSSELVTVEKSNEWPEGLHCFEPMLYVLSVGIIPTHCVDRYAVTLDSHEIGQAKVTMMQGWIALLMVPFPRWKYGYGIDAEPEIMDMVEVKE